MAEPNLTLADWRRDDGKLISCVWPGGYPVLYLTGDNGTLCPACANGENDSGATDPGLDESCPSDRQWLVVAGFVFYEGAPKHCDHCNAVTESAYGDPDNPEGGDDGH